MKPVLLTYLMPLNCLKENCLNSGFCETGAGSVPVPPRPVVQPAPVPRPVVAPLAPPPPPTSGGITSPLSPAASDQEKVQIYSIKILLTFF